MALTQVSTDGIKNGTITGTDLATNVDLVDDQKLRLGTGNDLQIFHQSSGSFNQIQGASGVNTRIRQLGNGGALYLAATNIYFQNHNNNQTFLHAVNNGSVKLNHSGNTKFETLSTGVLITGSDDGDGGAKGDFKFMQTDGTLKAMFDASASAFEFYDNTKAIFGNGDDLQIYHDGTDNLISTSGTVLAVHRGTTNASNPVFEVRSNHGATNQIKFQVDGDGDVLIPTDTGRLQLGVSQDLQIYHDGNSSFISNTTGDLTLLDQSRIKHRTNQFVVNNYANDESIIYAAADGEVSLYHNGSKKFDTTSTGIAVTGRGSFTDGNSGGVRIGNGDDLMLYHDTLNTYIDNSTGVLFIRNTTANNAIYSRSDELLLQSYTGNENYLVATLNGSVALYHDNTKRIETTSYGARVFGNFENHNGFITVKDDGKFTVGNSDDLQIYHDGSNSFIDNSTGGLFVRGNTIKLRDAAGNEDYIEAFQNGSVRLYHDNSQKFETSSTGATVTGTLAATNTNITTQMFMPDSGQIRLGDSDDLKIYHDGSNSVIAAANTGDLQIFAQADDILLQAADNIFIKPQNGESGITVIGNGAVELFYDNNKHFQTTLNGVEVDGELMIDPDAGGTLKFTGHAAHHSKMIIGDNGGTANGNLLIEGGDGTDFLQIASNGDIDIANAVGQTHAAKVAIQHGGINPRGLFVLSDHTSFQSITLQSAASRNTTNGSYRHFQCSINGVADKMRVMDSGNITNTNNSYGSLSDERLKENIVDASSQWDDIKALKIRKFNFKSLTDPDQKTMLGVVAQEAELVCPGLVTSEISMQEGVEQEYKSFKYSVLYMKAIKCLQEAMAKIEVLETEVAALKAA